MAQSGELTALLAVPPISPRGTSGASVSQPLARLALGLTFEHAEGKPNDIAEAAYWYALAAQGWVKGAYSLLGTLYANGTLGGTSKLDAARRLWITGAAIGEVDAMANLALISEKIDKDPTAVRRWNNLITDHKHAESLSTLRLVFQ